MATFTSVTSGNWNNGATWGRTSPGVKGTDWPGNAADVVNIGTTAGQAHVVVYNVSETNQLGAVTIGATTGTAQSILDFATNMSTKLTVGHVDILVQLTGELRIGALGVVLDKAYTAEIVLVPTSDNAKGISLSAGGKLTLYGDPALYGSDFDTSLYSAWNGSATTIYLAGDFSGKWLIGQELLIHKGGAYGTYTNDFALVSINGTVTYDGTKSTVPIALVHVPSAGSGFAAGGDVLNVSRNIMLYSSGYSHNISAYPTYRPRLVNSNTVGTTNINIENTQFSGWVNALINFGVFADRVVLRNGGAQLSAIRGGALTNIIVYSNNAGFGVANCSGLPISGYICNSPYSGVTGLAGCWTPQGQSLKIFGCGRGLGGYRNNFIAYIYANLIGLAAVNAGFENQIIRSGALGYNQAGNSCANGTDLEFVYAPSAVLINMALQTIPPSTTNRNLAAYPGKLRFEHYNQVANEHYILDAFGDVIKTPADGTGDNPSQRTGGNIDVIEAVPQSLCSATLFLEILNTRLWAAAGVSKTYRFYVQADFASLLTAAFKLYGDYLDQGSGGHLATVSSTQNVATRANAADWSQYVEVTINPAQDGYVNLYLRLMGYESGKKAWVDPKPEGVAMTPRWSYGEVVLEPITASGGGSVSPTNLGLVPLGIKQVAI